MKITHFCWVLVGWVGGAIAFGVAAGGAVELLMPPSKGAVAAGPVVAAEPVEAAAPAAGFALASATSTPVELAPVKVKTVPMVYREDSVTEILTAERPAANVPLPRPRPANAPGGDSTASIAHQPG